MVNFLNLKKNNSGIIFITVLVIIIVMMIVTISIISMNVSQVSVTEGEIKRIQAEMLGMGALNTFYANQNLSSPQNQVILPDANPATGEVYVGVRTFTVDAIKDTAVNATGINQTRNLTISVDY